MNHLSLKLATALAILSAVGPVTAYDGTNCTEPGVCWEAKPGYPDKIAGSKYDPRHDPNELAKQSESIKAMEERNAKRLAHARKTGHFIYEIDEIN